MVPEAGLEPALCCQNWILNKVRVQNAIKNNRIYGSRLTLQDLCKFGENNLVFPVPATFGIKT
ncbi:MAG: hypothetical protein WBN41_12430, partial [Lysobacterales bacterium]